MAKPICYLILAVLCLATCVAAKSCPGYDTLSRQIINPIDWMCILKVKVRTCLKSLSDEKMDEFKEKGCCKQLKRSCPPKVNCAFNEVCPEIEKCKDPLLTKKP